MTEESLSATGDTGLPRRMAEWFLPHGDPAKLVLVLMLLTCFFGLKSRWINPDSVGYYMFIVSPVVDGDFDYTNDLDRFGVEPVYRKNNFRPGVGGRPINPFAIGSPLLLAPFFMVGHLLAATLRALGWSSQPLWQLDLDGLYYKTLIVGDAMMAAMTLLLLHRMLRRLFSPAASLWGMLLCWFATPLPAYIYLYGNHSHVASAFAGTLACVLWLDTARQTTPRHYLWLGMAAGLAGLVRWQDALILGLALFPLARPPRFLRCLSAAAAGFWAVFSIQLIEWLMSHGTIFVQPPAQGFMQWFSPQIAGILLSARMGLLTWHPVFLVSILGFRHLYRRDRIVAAGAVAMIAAQFYVNACVPDWWGGNSFGQRRMMGILPLLALPMSAFYDGTVRGPGRTRQVAWALGAVLAAFNFLLFFQYYHQAAFFASGVFDYPAILANQWRVLARWGELVQPFLNETLWSQLAGVTAAGRLLVLAVWSAILAAGIALTARATREAGQPTQPSRPEKAAATGG
ncbi:MAG: hypothetical protein HY303_01935 [Candidatus Wallbacteria bacterium]|nr:hypothetical protein [Candidatus Wallbacteria bacterium]